MAPLQRPAPDDTSPMSDPSASPSCCHSDGMAASAAGMERELARELTQLRRKVSVAVVLTALVLLSSLPHMLGVQSLPFLPA